MNRVSNTALLCAAYAVLPRVSSGETLQPTATAKATNPVLHTTASFMTRYEAREGYRDLGRSRARFVEGEATVYRARLGLQTEPIQTGGPDVVLQFSPQASGWLGQTSTIVDYDLGLHEGYLRLVDPTEKYRVDAGRFEMNYGDALVIGNLGWHQTARAFEGVRARVAIGSGWVDGFVTQVAEGRPLSDPLAAGDTYFYGLYAGLGRLLSPSLALDFYALGQTSPGSTGLPDSETLPAGYTESVESASEFTFGVRAKQSLGAVGYRAELGIQKGFRPNVGNESTYLPEPVLRKSIKSLAYQLDGGLQFTVQQGLKLELGGLVASGDDPETARNEGWNQLYPTAHKFLGLSDVFGGRNNVASTNAGVSFKASSKLLLKAQGHAFWSLETPEGVEGFTGAELDTHAILLLGRGLKLRGVYGLFLSNDKGRFSGPPDSEELAHYLEVELSFALK